MTGTANAPVDIGVGTAQSFLIAVTASLPIASTDVALSFDCANSDSAAVHSGLNTLLLSAAVTPVPDIVALGRTPSSDGRIGLPGAGGTGAFSVAAVNVGASGSITASADTGSASLPLTIAMCQTNPTTGSCTSAVGPTVTTQINASETPTFSVFVAANGAVPFDPATNRIFVRFRDAGNVVRGATSVAVETR